MPSMPTNPRPRRRRRARGAPRRTLTFKFKVSAEERDVIRARARGYATAAAYARTTLVAGWAMPMETVQRVTVALHPIQALIEKGEACGLASEAGAATDALREILAAVSRR